MTTKSPNLRKAAVLLRSLDGETAATMLAQLSPAEATRLREAIRALGPVDAEEQADVVAEFRRVTPFAAESAADGVELSLTSTGARRDFTATTSPQVDSGSKRFDFLERAPINALVPYLGREHVQTIALVLSHLRPERAAAVLAALSGRRQAEVIDRLAALGDSDPESVTVLENELAAWVENRAGGKSASDRRGAVASILAAADLTTRNGIMANLKEHKSPLAEQLADAPAKRARASQAASSEVRLPNTVRAARQQRFDPPPLRPSRPTPPRLPAIRLNFDQLIQLDDRTLSAVLGDIDPSILVLALAGSREDLVDRICTQMPKRVARDFRRQLRRLGPTRLSDVETAQRAVAHAAAQRLADRRSEPAADTF